MSKRVLDYQLTKDNADENIDNSVNFHSSGNTAQQRASQEVLSQRKILKVKRSGSFYDVNLIKRLEVKKGQEIPIEEKVLEEEKDANEKVKNDNKGEDEKYDKKSEKDDNEKVKDTIENQEDVNEKEKDDEEKEKNNKERENNDEENEKENILNACENKVEEQEGKRKENEENKEISKLENGGKNEAENSINSSSIANATTSSSCVPEASVLTETKTYLNSFAVLAEKGTNSFLSSSSCDSSNSQNYLDISDYPSDNPVLTPTPFVASKEELLSEDVLFCDLYAKLSRFMKNSENKEGEWMAPIVGKVEIIKLKDLEEKDGGRIVFYQCGSARLMLNSEIDVGAKFVPQAKKSVIFNGRKIDDESKLCTYRLTFSEEDVRSTFLKCIDNAVTGKIK